MAKLLSLGTKLKYPITITKLHKKPGDRIAKEQGLLEYKWTWENEVGDPILGNTWMETQNSYGDWDSPVDGSIKAWKVHVGQVIDKDCRFLEVDEDCPHSVQFQGLCGMCGKDMTEVSWASSSDDTARAQINMIHDQTTLKVSEDEAFKAEGELQRRLLQNRKLSLVVDLDQTIIHACIDPTVGEWRDDPTSPNYDAVKDVKSFQLNDDGPRGVASGCWYYIKMRPGLAEFLARVSEIYELHVYTMGTRAYAMNIAKIVDPEKKLFGDRIISRDENGNVTAKSLSRLFPVDTKMVVIIDDRADVWPNNRPNLIKVVPYDFFLGIGDINSSFLPKREELPKLTPSPKKKTVTKVESTESEDAENTEPTETPDSAEETPADEKPSSQESIKGKDDAELTEENGSRVSALEEFVKMGGGDDQVLRLEQAAEQEKSLEKQLIDRPLLHLQEELDQKDEEELEQGNNSDTSKEHHRHNLLKDDDDELIYLEQHLADLHKSFYDEYDSALVSASGGRVAQLKPGVNKKVSLKDASANHKIVPDIGQVMPRLKSRIFEGCRIVTSGLVPLNIDIKRSEIGLQIQSFGAVLSRRVSRKVTHLITSTSRTRTKKVKEAAKYDHIKIVNMQWLLHSMSRWERQNENNYLVEIHESDRIPDHNSSSIPSSIQDSDESSEDLGSGSGSEIDDETSEDVPGSQEFFDKDGVMPDDAEPGHSPIDELGKFDWGGIDDELEDFLASGDESETGSVTSTSSRLSSRSNGSVNGDSLERKRKLDQTEEDEDSDDTSKLSKKQKIANTRSTSLKAVKTPNSESLPTPIGTGDEAGDDRIGKRPVDEATDDGGFDDLEADLEADLMAEFDREEAEAAEAESHAKATSTTD